MTSIRLAFVLLFGALLAAGCKSETDNPKDKVFDVKGKVTAVDAEKKRVTLDHEEIPGLMMAMEMPFNVADEKILQAVKAGDQVQGKLKVMSGKYTITELQKR